MSARTDKGRTPETFGAWARIGLGVATLVFLSVAPDLAQAQSGLSIADVRPDPKRVTRIDAELANACVESGQSKQVCICEVRLLRVSIDPHDYAPSALLQTAAYSRDASSLTAARHTLRRNGVSEPEIKALDRERRRVVRERLEPGCRQPRNRMLDTPPV